MVDEPAASARGADAEFEAWWDIEPLDNNDQPQGGNKTVARAGWNAARARDQARIRALAEVIKIQGRTLHATQIHDRSGQVDYQHCRWPTCTAARVALAAALPPAEQEEG